MPMLNSQPLPVDGAKTIVGGVRLAANEREARNASFVPPTYAEAGPACALTADGFPLAAARWDVTTYPAASATPSVQ